MAQSRLSLPLLVATLLVLQTVLLAPGFEMFFQGDDIAALAQRYDSVGAAAAGFAEVDPQGWYRPLPRLLTSVLYGLFGLTPVAFRLVAILLLAALSLVVLMLLEALCDDSQAALAGAFFFAVHSVHAFTTFGPAFFPELLYALFYGLAVLLFLKAGSSQASGSLQIGAAGAFVLALMSKESALTLPVLLLALLLMEQQRLAPARMARRLSPFVAILLIDVGWLLASRHQRVVLETGGDIPTGLVTAGGWMFNLGPALGGGGPLANTAALLVLVVVVSTWLRFLIEGRYLRVVLMALVWTSITLAPALALGSLKPYYIVLPLVGAALLFGQAVTGTLHELAGSRGLLAAALFAAVALSSGSKISANLTTHSLLGGSAAVSGRLADQTRRELGELPPRCTLLILDDNPAGAGLAWPTAGGQLFEILYPRSQVDVRMLSLGEWVTEAELAEPDLRVLDYRSGELRLVDPEAVRRQGWERLGIPPENRWGPTRGPAVAASIEPDRVRAGTGSYQLRVSAYPNSDVEVQFRIDQGPIALGRFSLDDRGRARQFVSRLTSPGRYRFLAVRVVGQDTWRPLEGPPELIVEAGRL